MVRYLASDAPSSANASPARGWLASSLLIAIGITLCLLLLNISSKKIDSVSALTKVNYISYKEYAYLKIESLSQYKCLTKLYGKESAWNPRAVGNLTGTYRVYGIPQGKSEYLRNASPYQQIDWGLSYIAHKFGLDDDGYINACKAYKHWQLKGWH